MGFNLSKIQASIAETMGNITKKAKKADLVPVQKTIDNGEQKVLKLLDALSSNAKAIIRKDLEQKINVGKISDINPIAKKIPMQNDAVAKITNSFNETKPMVTNSKIGKSAEDSAQVFIENGKTQAELKQELLSKYKNDLANKKATQEFLDEVSSEKNLYDLYNYHKKDLSAFTPEQQEIIKNYKDKISKNESFFKQHPYKSAEDSAQVFIENGKTKPEIKLDQEDLKLNLLKKHPEFSKPIPISEEEAKEIFQKFKF